MIENDRVWAQFLDVARREYFEAVARLDFPVAEEWGKVIERLWAQAEGANA